MGTPWEAPGINADATLNNCEKHGAIRMHELFEINALQCVLQLSAWISGCRPISSFPVGAGPLADKLILHSIHIFLDPWLSAFQTLSNSDIVILEVSILLTWCESNADSYSM